MGINGVDHKKSGQFHSRRKKKRKSMKELRENGLLFKQKLDNKQKARNQKVKNKLARLDAENLKKRLSKQPSKADRYRNKLMKSPTVSEKQLLEILELAGIKFVFQYVVQDGEYFRIADFYLPQYRVCVEVDGGYHNTDAQIKNDFAKSKFLNKHGFHVLRITNGQVPGLRGSLLLKRLKEISKIVLRSEFFL